MPSKPAASAIYRATACNGSLPTKPSAPMFARRHSTMVNYSSSTAKKKYISCLNPKSGDIIWQTELGGRIIFRSSPTIADGKIYCMNHRGEITVLNAKTGDILSQSKMGEPNADMVRASVAVAQSNLFIRTNYHLYCIENSASTSINTSPVISTANSSKR